ncbi:cytidylate kinase [Paraphysoderma sedebokerense]|nr:cytidylate kinase [Paraphysoderma sedebokerense]
MYRQLRNFSSFSSPKRIHQIAIDGPAGSGKSSTAFQVSKALPGFVYIDSGAMFRCVTLKALEQNVPLVAENEKKLEKIAHDLVVSMVPTNTEATAVQIFIGSDEVTHSIRSSQVTRNVSFIAGLPSVRAALLEKKRAIGGGIDGTPDESYVGPVPKGIVMDGRDIGTVVFPRAGLKIFLVADPKIRAQRRYNELKSHHEAGKVTGLPSLDEIHQEILKRDAADYSRTISPLKRADDAIEIDSTSLTKEQVVDEIVSLANKRFHIR